MKLLVTGGAGFIGSTYARLFADEHELVVLDKLTYAGRRENVPADVELVVGGIEDRELVMQVADGVDAVVNFAAESHVDRSIADQDVFARTHVIGTGVLLDAVRELGVPRYLQVSTDEVYGSIAEGSFTESSPLDPSSPYSATKAAGDLLVSAHHHTYGVEAVICRGSNNYGPRQYPEKLIPLAILNAMHGDPLPVYGDGRQVRNWLFVEDFCRGIHTVLERGRPGETYNVGGPDEDENIQVVRRILELTGRDESLIEHVTDRPGHDRRYSLSSQKLARRAGLGGGGPLRRRPGTHGRVVPGQRGLVEPDPLRRVPRVLREALRQGPRLTRRSGRLLPQPHGFEGLPLLPEERHSNNLAVAEKEVPGDVELDREPAQPTDLELVKPHDDPVADPSDPLYLDPHIGPFGEPCPPEVPNRLGTEVTTRAKWPRSPAPCPERRTRRIGRCELGSLPRCRLLD